MNCSVFCVWTWLWIIQLCALIASSGVTVDYEKYEDYSVFSSSNNNAGVEDALLNKDFIDSIPYPHQVVYPIQMRMNEVLPDLSTRDLKAKTKNAHYHHTNFELFMFDHRYRIKLEQNREILSSGLKQKYSHDEKMQIVEGSFPENCYYQGQIRKVPNSFVAVSTCRGIRGLIMDSGTVYHIHPLKERVDGNETQFPHLVVELPPSSQGTCGNIHGMWKSYKNLHQREFLGNVKIMKPQEDDASEDPKFLKLALVADHSMFEQLNDTVTDSVQYFILLANIVDALMKEFRIKIQFVYLEIWNQKDHFVVDDVARATLSAFLRYRLEMMMHSDYDFAHFLTAHALGEGKIGMSIPDSMCSDRAVSISQIYSIQDLLQAAVGVAHMLGHVLGVEHDVTGNCSCNDPYGCIMGHTSLGNLLEHAHIWSSCSNKSIRESFLSKLNFCLKEKPDDKPTFREECGNGLTERSEECDCLNREECETTDPCCDSKTCLMKSWAMCRYGDCCHNCTVMPSNQMCRREFGECDVPEFCDGASGECPANVLVQDGHICGNGESFCYKGNCNPYLTQCKSIWGEGAVGADDNCYEMFNMVGRFNGHCGHNASTGKYLKCSVENIKCGLLHCANGTDRPLHSENKTFSVTTITSQGNNYQCKVVNGLPDVPSFGMVKDGTKCSSGGICVNAECISLSRIMPTKCPVGLNGLTCSGHGKCTTELRCFCSYNYTGVDCSQRSNRTIFFLTQSATEAPPATTALTDVPSLDNITEQLHSNMSFLTQSPLPIDRSDSTTLELVIALSIVIVGALVILGFCLICYRRKSPVSTAKKKKKNLAKNFHGSVASFSSSLHSKSRDQGFDPCANRSISFGLLPSYRADKIKKAMRGGFSETESEHSRGDRDSTEVKTAHTLPLAKPPEKGILKKHPRSAENPRRTRSRDVEQLVAKRDSGMKNHYDVKSDPKNVAGNADRKFLLEARNRVSDAADGSNIARSHTANCPADKCSSDDGLDFIDDDEADDDSVRSCSSEEDDVSPSVSDGLKNDSDFDPSQSCAAVVGGEKSPQRELQAFFVTAAVDEHKKKLRKNITDLLKQFDEFDEQFNSVLSRTAVSPADVSPSNSLEYRAKEANANEERVPNGILPQKETESAAPNSRTYSKYDTNSGVDIQDKHLTGLPDLLDSGIQKLSLKSAETVRNNVAAKPLVHPQKENELDSDRGRNVKQNGSSPSGMTPNPVVLPSSKTVLPSPRTHFYTSPFVAKPANSEPFRKPAAKAEDTRNKSAEVKPDASHAVPYCEATTSESPRVVDQRTLFQPDFRQDRSDGNSKTTCSAARPGDISVSANKQSTAGSATNCEGCHGDRANASDKAIVIREIPATREYPFAPGSHGSSTKAPVVLSSPEDIDV